MSTHFVSSYHAYVLFLFPALVFSFAAPTNGLAQTDWIKYQDNPVLDVGPEGSWDAWAVCVNSVLFDGSTYRMWYFGFDGTNLRIGLATSSNGINWTKSPDNPVLDLGNLGEWDDVWAAGPSVIYVGNIYKMWYTGFDDSTNFIGYAESPDGIHWTKSTSNPVLKPGGAGAWDEHSVAWPTVVFDGTRYHMWYHGYRRANERLGYATSMDGLNWTKSEANPVLDLRGPNSQENINLGSRPVHFDGSMFTLWYHIYIEGKLRIQFAVSTDGMAWTMFPGSYVVDSEKPTEWNGFFVAAPVVLFDGTTYQMWYNGFDGKNLRVGYATAYDPSKIKQTNIAIRDAGSGVATLTFGQAPMATDSLDPSLGEAELPPPPPMGVFDARFELPITPPIGSQRDFRHIAQAAITWKIKFQPGLAGYPMTLSWNIADLPPGDFHLKDEVTGTIINVNMKDQNSVTVANSAITSLIIEKTILTWQANLTVSDAGNGMATLTFGQGSTATDNLDTSLDEIELPPIPPTGVFDARFELPVSPPAGSFKDYRNDAEEKIIWKIKFQAGSGGFPITLRWNSAALPSKSSFYLKDALTGKLINVSMKNQDRFEVTNNAITLLTIEMTNEISRSVEVAGGWNIISVPALTKDMRVDSLFPGAASDAFRFDNGYVVADTLANGIGYWLKFNRADTFQITGLEVAPKEILVKAGWNIIGPFESDVPASAITSDPSGIVQSEYFQFENAYKPDAILRIGKGYWVKIGKGGKLLLPSGGSASKKTQSAMAVNTDQEEISLWPQIRIEDSKGKFGALYLAPGKNPDGVFELPPLPPTGIFDIRYSSGRYVESVNAAALEILITSAQYPIKIKAENFETLVLSVQDTLGGKALNETLTEGKEIEIAKPLDRLILKIDASSLLPTRYELRQNYPNPFNPTTMIKYALPKAGHVKISVYNILGEKVTDLVDTDLAAGYHQVEVNARQYASGVYFYVMKAGEFKAVKKLVIVK